MTTYEEISTCRKANRLYHNQQVRFKIALYRDAQIRYAKHKNRSYFVGNKVGGIEKALRERGAYNSLIDFVKPPCGSCTYCLVGRTH